MVAPVIVRAVGGGWQHRRSSAPGQTLPLAACMQGVMIPGHLELTLNHDSVVLWQLPSLQATIQVLARWLTEMSCCRWMPLQVPRVWMPAGYA